MKRKNNYVYKHQKILVWFTIILFLSISFYFIFIHTYAFEKQPVKARLISGEKVLSWSDKNGNLRYVSRSDSFFTPQMNFACFKSFEGSGHCISGYDSAYINLNGEIATLDGRIMNHWYIKEGAFGTKYNCFCAY